MYVINEHYFARPTVYWHRLKHLINFCTRWQPWWHRTSTRAALPGPFSFSNSLMIAAFEARNRRLTLRHGVETGAPEKPTQHRCAMAKAIRERLVVGPIDKA